MLKIGLTGGIGSGKTTVAQLFAKLGVPIIDADIIVHTLSKPKTCVSSKIIKHFGSEFTIKNGQLNRKKLRDFIFKHPSERRWLENLLHPLVYAQIAKDLKLITQPYCIIVIPLLFETKGSKIVDRTLVVDCPQKIQIERIHSRDQTPKLQVKKIINSQIERQKRLQLADDIICNKCTLDKLNQNVIMLHLKYLALAGSR